MNASKLPAYASRIITVYYDDATDPNNPGWVTRCTEFDSRNQAIPGRVAMDEQLDSATLSEAIAEAAAHWGCSAHEVTFSG